MTRFTCFVLLIVVFACGDDDRGGEDGGRTDGGGTCSADEDCNDGHDCTIDSCGVGGMCRFDTINERCPSPQICEVGRGCVDEPSCGSDDECDDGFDCTLDSCGVGGDCRNMPLDELCASVGPGSTCDPTTGMAGSGCTEPTGCETDEDCDDGVDCTLDSCSVDMTCARTLIDERCDEGEVCTATGCFMAMPCETAEECDDGNFCNGVETCEPEFGCRPAETPRVCNDSDDCTIDSCDVDLDMCVFRCDSAMAGCDCPMGDVPCEGIFDISPAPMQRCAELLGPPQVNYNVSEVEFTCVGPVVSVDARNVPNPMLNSALTQTPRSDDGTFDVVTMVDGDCVETYRLQGMFIDEDTFEATWTASYAGFGCGFAGCSAQNIPVTGTRR